jgi:hypothetical protein
MPPKSEPKSALSWELFLRIEKSNSSEPNGTTAVVLGFWLVMPPAVTIGAKALKRDEMQPAGNCA